MSTAEKLLEADSQEDLEPKDELETAGWQRRFEADASKAGELVDLYSDLGFEVTTCKIAPQEIGPECAGCAIVACHRYVALYTRRHEEGDGSPKPSGSAHSTEQ